MNAERLVKKLGMLGIIVHGQSFQIYRHNGQAQMNKAAGEAAPTWELLVNPLRNSLNGKIIKNGSVPVVDFPNGCRWNTTVYGFQPLTHILKTPLDLWDVDTDELNRVLVSTMVTPQSWK